MAADRKPAQLNTLWPVSGKPGQDVIVLNPMGLSHLEQTAPDYQQLQWAEIRIMESHSDVAGWPPFIAHNPRQGPDQIVGGVKLRGNTGYYSVDGKGRVQVEGDANSFERQSKMLERQARGEEAYAKRMDESAVTNPDPNQTQQPQNSSTDSLIFVGLVIVGIAAWYFLYYKKHHKGGEPLEAIR